MSGRVDMRPFGGCAETCKRQADGLVWGGAKNWDRPCDGHFAALSAGKSALDVRSGGRLHIHGIKEMPAGYDAEVAELFRDLRAASGLTEADLAAQLATRLDVVQALEQGAIYALPPGPRPAVWCRPMAPSSISTCVPCCGASMPRSKPELSSLAKTDARRALDDAARGYESRRNNAKPSRRRGPPRLRLPSRFRCRPARSAPQRQPQPQCSLSTAAGAGAAARTATATMAATTTSSHESRNPRQPSPQEQTRAAAAAAAAARAATAAAATTGSHRRKQPGSSLSLSAAATATASRSRAAAEPRLRPQPLPPAPPPPSRSRRKERRQDGASRGEAEEPARGRRC